MQKRVYNILVFLLLTATASGQASPSMLQTADSLYAAKQYTQAFERYDVLFAGGRYSPAMLLKMAHIQEGLGHLGQALYYINLYFIATNDTAALRKMEELAEKNNLEGYQNNESKKLKALLNEYNTTITLFLVVTCLFFFSLVVYTREKKKIRPTFSSAMLVLSVIVLFVYTNFSSASERGIVAAPKTYLMSGPSAGAALVAIIGEGHQLEITGKKDVWLKVQWKEREVYVKEFLLKPIKL